MTDRPAILDAHEAFVVVPASMDVKMIGEWYRYKNGHRWPGEEPPRDTSDTGAYERMLAARPDPTALADVVRYVEELEAGKTSLLTALYDLTGETHGLMAIRKLAARITALEALLVEAERALEPFAEQLEAEIHPSWDDTMSLDVMNQSHMHLTVGNLRAASAAVTKIKETRG